MKKHMFLACVVLLEFNAHAMVSMFVRQMGASYRVTQAAYLSHYAGAQSQMTDDELVHLKNRVNRMKEDVYRLNEKANDLKKTIDSRRSSLPYCDGMVRDGLKRFWLRAAGVAGSIGGMKGMYDYTVEHELSLAGGVPLISFCALVCTTVGFSIATRDAGGILVEKIEWKNIRYQNIKRDEANFDVTVKVLIDQIKELERVEARVQECETVRTIPALKTWFDMQKELNE